MAKKRVAKKATSKTGSASKAKTKSMPAKKAKAGAKKAKSTKKAATPPTPVEPVAHTSATQPLKPPPMPKPKSPAAAPDMAQAQPKLDKSPAHQRELKAATMKGRIAKSAAGPNITGHISARGRRTQARRDSKN
jgi:hypothetical protein